MATDAVVVDASAFLGMHSSDDAVRRSCKAFFALRLDRPLVMSLEEVGRCDDAVWRFPRAVQDAYYPFMDNLHTDARIERVSYEEDDVRTALDHPALAGLLMAERLLLGLVLRLGAVLHTANDRLLTRRLPVRPILEADAGFPDGLERLYRESLALRVPAGTRLPC